MGATSHGGRELASKWSPAGPLPNRQVLGTLYVGVVVALGSAVVAHSVWTLVLQPIGFSWLVLAGLTWVGGWFAFKVPRVPLTLSLSETFVFILIMLFGGAPATVTVALDGLISSYRGRNRSPRRILFNFAEPAVSVWCATQAYYWAAGVPPLAEAAAPLSVLLLPTLAMSAVFFVLNSGLTALAVATENRLSPFQVWRSHLIWIWLNYFGGSSIALLVALNTREVSISSVGAVAPLLVLLYFAFHAWVSRIEDSNHHLADLNRLYLATVETLAMAIDAKDQVTHGHIRRVQVMAIDLARALGVTDPHQLEALETAALLHDMGKLAVPDHILNKSGRLTEAEYEEIKLHPSVGADILSAVDFPYPVVPIVRHHHENWDGSGYPSGLKGDHIPIGARILSVIDCYDALTSHRPYRRALSSDEALAIITERRGRMYDPVVVDAFLARAPQPAAAREGTLLANPLTRMPRPECRPSETPDAEPRPSGLILCPEGLGALSQLSQSVVGRLGTDDLAAVISRHVRRLTPATLVAFYLADPDRGDLALVHASGRDIDEVAPVRIRPGSGVSGWVVVNGQTVVNADPALDFAQWPAAPATPFRSAMSVPLMADGDTLGALTLYAPAPSAFTAEHRQVIEIASRPITHALCLAQGTRPSKTFPAIPRLDSEITSPVNTARAEPRRLSA
jgi:putative nucleotidyltransferase with HDIG domain